MQDLINQFYTAFQQLDAEGMHACYHDDIEFWDPAFGKLKGDDASHVVYALSKCSRSKIRVF